MDTRQTAGGPRDGAARSAWHRGLCSDLVYALRSMLRAPLFAAFAVLTLALGIGANAAVFGVLKSVLIDALPYADADRVVRVYGTGFTDWEGRQPISAGTVADLRERQQSFATLAAYTGLSDMVYRGADGARTARAAWVEPGFFETLGVAAATGRTFRADEGADMLPVMNGDRASAARAVVLTHAGWQQLLGGDSDVLGRDVDVDGSTRTVVGVLPRGYVGPMGQAELYFAMDLGPVAADPVVGRGSHWLGLVGRLRADASHEAAQSELDTLAAALASEHPRENGERGLAAVPLRDAMVGDTRTPLLVLMASAGLVLLVACTNLAGAFLSRTLSRRKELAVRAALGAGRARIVRQVLAESTLLGLAGGAVGLLLAGGLLMLLRESALPALPAYAEWSLGGGAVLVAGVLSVLAGIAFGVAPALAVTRGDPQATLRDESRGASESRRSRRLRGALVAGQIALCLSLLMGAFLLTRSLWAMTSAPLGFDPDGVLAVEIQVPPGEYESPEELQRFYAQLTERLRGLPGVDSAAVAAALPTAVMNRMGLEIEGSPVPEGGQPFVLYTRVSDDYFRTLRIPLQAGRVFDARDHADAPATIVLSESMARRYWPGGDALGSRIRLGPDPESPLMEVVGVVGDVRNDRTRPDVEPMAYASSRHSTFPMNRVVLRASADPLGLVVPVGREIAAVDAGVAMDRALTLRAAIGEELAGRRLPVLLMCAFGALALVLASLGIYAMFAAMTIAREWEFGVRMALGSRPLAIAGLVLRQGAGWLAAGVAFGVLGIVAVAYGLRDLLYGVPPLDPVALVTTVIALGVCAGLALVGPVRRATRVDPAVALRAR